MTTLTITPESYMGKDIDALNDIIKDILEECHGIEIDSLSFDINVNFTEVPEEPREWSASEAYLEVCWHREGGE